MHLITTITMLTTPRQIWGALFDPHLLSQCMPGLTEWQEIEPQRVYRLLIAWGSGPTSKGIQVPVVVQWGEAIPLKRIGWEAKLLLGNQPIHLQGRVSLTLQQNGVSVALETRMNEGNPTIAQMAYTVAPKILQPFLKCLRRRLEDVDTHEG